MGRMQAESMAEFDIPLETAIRWQLRNNHFPPVPSEMIPVSIKAVELAREGKYTEKITTPFEHRTYGWKVPAYVIVDAYHLEPWLNEEVD